MIILSWLFFISCAQNRFNAEEEKAKIRQSWNDWSLKAQAGQPEYYFSDSAIYMIQGQPTAKGKQEISRVFSNRPNIPGMKVNWHGPYIIDFSRTGDMAYSLDTLELSIPDSTGKVQTLMNRGLHLWKKDDQGNWRVTLMMVYPEK
jgi:ketosteroid isomerase-like protein